ncbi:hypothetical protein ACHAPT_004180 [Fusarium lateritium]
MPSLTEYFGHTITNFGPLTTTFTAPSSCAAQTTGRIMFANASNLAQHFGNPTCGGGYVGECIPSGSAYDDYVSTYWETPVHAWYPYHSPGLVCPSGWSTVGTFARTGNTSSVDASGVFTKDPLEGYPDRVRPWLGPDELWSNALKPSETLAQHRRRQTRIDSVVPITESYSSKTMVITEFLGTEELEDWVVGSIYPAVALVYQETDVAKAKEQGDESDDKDDDEEEDSKSSAARVIAPVLAVAFGMLAGVGLLIPW